MSTLQVCWVAVAACTVIFLIVAAVSALPKMKAPYTAMIASIFLAASGITAFGSIAPYLSPPGLVPPAAAGPYKLPPARYRARRWLMTPRPGRWSSPSTTARTPTRAGSSPS